MRQLKQKPVLNTVKSFEIACGIIVAIGLFLAIGAVGGCERETLSEGRAIMYSVIGLVMATAGALGLRWFSQFEDSEDEYEERGNDNE